MTAETEWARVAPILERLIETRDRQPFGPLISIDTYRTTTARKALRLGVDMVNDVGGLSSEEMIELAGESGVDFVAMHQLSLPVDPKITLAQDADPYAALEQWLLARLERWEKAGLNLNRIIFDPGIGFGKTVQQNHPQPRGHAANPGFENSAFWRKIPKQAKDGGQLTVRSSFRQ